MLDVVDDFVGDVAAGNSFDAEARGGVYLEDERTARGAHKVDTGNVKTHGLCGFDGNAAFFGGKFNASSLAALVEVAAEIIIKGLAFHAGDDARANDEGANVGAGGLFDVFLEENVSAVFVVEVEGLEGGLGGFFGFGEDNAVAVGARGELNNDREADLLEEVVDVGGVTGNEGLRGVDAGLGENLLRTELVAGADDSDGARGSPDALHLELADDGATVASHAIRDTGQNRIKTGEVFAVVIDVWVFFVKRKITILIFDNAHLMTALLGFFDEAFRGIVGIAI